MKNRNWQMKYGKWLGLLWLGLALTARATDYGDLRIQIENLSPGTHEHGYVEYRATISNRSATQTHRVVLQLPATAYAVDGNVIRSLTRTLEVAPGASVAVSLFKPALEMTGSDAAVLIDGVLQSEALALPSSSVAHDRYQFGGHLLVSQAVKQSGAMLQAEAAWNNNSGGTNFDYATLELAVSAWSRDWLGYSSYDGVLVTSAELRAAPEAVREALQRYVECGGTLLVFGAWEVAPVWQDSRQATAWQEAAVTVTPPPAAAEAAPEATPAPTPTPPVAVRQDLQHYTVGFGMVMTMGEQEKPALTAAQWQAAHEHWKHTADALSQNYQNDNNQLNLIGGVTTPLRGLFLLMLLFVLVIGPLNVWLLSRWRKRLWLLWTVPAISLLTCLAVAGFALFREGLQASEGVSCLTILDETARRATTLGFVGFYAPLTPRAGLHFGVQTELTPLLPYRYYGRGNNTRRSLDWTNDQHLTTGWVAARVPAELKVRKSETRRERLTITTTADGAVSVVNGLGAPIEKLLWVNAQGVIFAATDVAAGAAAALEATEQKIETPPVKTMRDPLRDYRSENIFFVENLPEKFLRPGHYLATLKGAPFIESALANIRERRAKTLVYGIPAAQTSDIRHPTTLRAR